MPEAPEVRYLSEIAKKYMMGKTINSITTKAIKKINLPNKSKVIDIGTKGKLLWLETVDYFVYIHFGLTGWILFRDSKYPKYIIELNGLTMYIDDSRHFSSIIILNNKSKHMKLLNTLGIDILSVDFTLDFFSSKIKSKMAMLVAVLMDQSIFAGIGNYIKNESLYLSHIDPHRKANSLSDTEIKLLYNNIRFVSFSNFIEMIKTAKLKVPIDIKKIMPNKLEVPYKFKVYSNTVDSHGNKITIENIGGRTTYYVKSLQY